jgi:hypothetical protein
MIRAAYVIGRILAALGAVLVVTTVILTLVSFGNADSCSDPDCDDIARDDAAERAIIMLPISILVGAAGVALINDTYRRV